MRIYDFKMVHIIGIGGIGMSAIASVLKLWGIAVQGSNAVSNINVERLHGMGVKVLIGHSVHNIDTADLISYSSAVPADNEELRAALSLGKVVMNRAQLLQLMLKDKQVLSIAGSNGKTTVTSIIGHIMIEANRDPTVILGGIMKKVGCNFIVGDSDLVVLEADESDGSFLQINSVAGVLTNIEDDHSDYYGSFDALKQAFCKFAEDISNIGKFVVNIDALDQFDDYDFKDTMITFCVNGDKADFYLEDSHINERGGCDFTVCTRSGARMRFSSPLEGFYNVANVVAAVALATSWDVSYQDIYRAIDSLQGISRRLETVGYYRGCRVIDDYGHHPSAIESCIKAAKLSIERRSRVLAIIQPHRYSRVKKNFGFYLKALSMPDFLFLTDVFAAGEKLQQGYTSVDLLNNLCMGDGNEACIVSDLKSLICALDSRLKQGDLILFMGAGDITNWARDLVKLH